MIFKWRSRSGFLVGSERGTESCFSFFLLGDGQVIFGKTESNVNSDIENKVIVFIINKR